MGRLRVADKGTAECLLCRKISGDKKCCLDEKKSTYLSDINKPAHQVLVGEGIDGILRLLACSVLHNSMRSLVNELKRKRKGFTHPHPCKYTS